MHKILFGDNQFFGINHLSEEKAMAQALRFRNINKIISVLEYVYDIGIRVFMCTTHDRIADICEYFRKHSAKYSDFEFYPCMPYAHKYANAVTELGIIGALKKFMEGHILGSVVKGGLAIATKDYISIMQLLIDAEMSMFKDLNTPIIFLQNVVTDLLLGLGMKEIFLAFYEYIQKKYKAEAGFITMNMPMLLDTLEEIGIKNPIICFSINKIGFRMSGGRELYERTLKERNFRAIAMQVLAAGALSPKEAIEYVCSLDGIDSILFGASTPAHIKETKELIETNFLKKSYNELNLMHNHFRKD